VPPSGAAAVSSWRRDCLGRGLAGLPDETPVGARVKICEQGHGSVSRRVCEWLLQCFAASGPTRISVCWPSCMTCTPLARPRRTRDKILSRRIAVGIGDVQLLHPRRPVRQAHAPVSRHSNHPKVDVRRSRVLQTPHPTTSPSQRQLQTRAMYRRISMRSRGSNWSRLRRS
jgi:hypothetical protein